MRSEESKKANATQPSNGTIFRANKQQSDRRHFDVSKWGYTVNALAFYKKSTESGLEIREVCGFTNVSEFILSLG